jgi:hypothetical protein
MIPDPRKPGKFKKVKKQIPDYISEHDAMVLASCRKMAYRLDMSLFNIFGIRFGWESVIGLIPFAGDAFGVGMAMILFKKANGIEGGLDSSTRARMIINILLDFLVGLVPFVGDLVDAMFKCNTKNVRLLEEVLDAKYKPSSQRVDERDLAGMSKSERAKNRKSGIYHPRDPPPATVFLEDSDEEELHASTRPAATSAPATKPAPAPATAPTGTAVPYNSSAPNANAAIAAQKSQTAGTRP